MTDREDYEVTIASAEREDNAPDWERQIYGAANWLDARLGVRFWTLAGLLAASLIAGTPHILVHYQCYGRCGQSATEFNCRYLGVGGWQTAAPEQGKCARITLR